MTLRHRVFTPGYDRAMKALRRLARRKKKMEEAARRAVEEAKRKARQ